MLVMPETISKEPRVYEGHFKGDVECKPSHVLAKGFGLYTGVVNQPNIFELDARQAGVGDFDVVVKGESRATIEYVEVEDSLYKVKYYVSLPGEYQVEVKYDFEHITGSPFTAKILDPSESSSPSLTDSESLSSVSMESISNLATDDAAAVTGVADLPIVAIVTSPSGRNLRGTVLRKPSKKYAVKFPREEIGIYVVNVVHRKTGKSVRGSPYSIEVKPQPIETTVTATGSGLRTAKIGHTNDFSLSGTTILNASDVAIGIVGRASCKIRVFQSENSSLDVLYEVKKAGTYQVHVQEFGQNIPSSPFEVSVEAGNQWLEVCENRSDANEISSITFTLWLGQDISNHALTTSVRSPSNTVLAHAVNRQGSHVIELRFLPVESGLHTIHLSFGNRVSRQYLFNALVSNVVAASNALRLTGDGLKGACVKTPAHVVIDSLFPISRSFAVEFDGPDKVDIMHARTSDGRYVITYCGKRPGRYIMSIKYDGYHIHGSPFLISITKPDTADYSPDADSQPGHAQLRVCRAYGIGLAHAVVGQTNTFTVDAFRAGPGALLVGFNDSPVPTEVVAKHVGKCVYEVEYRIEKEGSYSMYVLWAGRHITGSPYTVVVVPSRHKLE